MLPSKLEKADLDPAPLSYDADLHKYDADPAPSFQSDADPDPDFSL